MDLAVKTADACRQMILKEKMMDSYNLMFYGNDTRTQWPQSGRARTYLDIYCPIIGSGSTRL